MVEHEPRVIETLGRRRLESGEAWRRRSDSGVDYWLKSDAAGIYRVATRANWEGRGRQGTALRAEGAGRGGHHLARQHHRLPAAAPPGIPRARSATAIRPVP